MVMNLQMPSSNRQRKSKAASSKKVPKPQYQVAVVGGAGHVGIPLSLVLADRGLPTLIYDINQAALQELQAGRLPFIEEGGEELLRKNLRAGSLGFSQDPADLRGIPAV